MTLGLVRGDGMMTGPIGSLMLAGLGLLYHRGAVQAGRVLRFALQQEAPPSVEG